MAERHPSDVIVDDVLRLYRGNIARLEGIVTAGLRRGLDPDRLGTPRQRRGDSTAAYRLRQLEQAQAITRELERQGAALGPLIVGRAYRSGVVSVDRVLAAGGTPARLAGEFGRVHVRAVEALAGNLSASLAEAARQAGANVELVFARADALEGALPGSGRIDGVPFLGRRLDDPYRKLALETVAGGAIGLDTRRQVSARLARRLVNSGVTDAVTGFVDRAGRRWPLDVYAGMVARTTTREAMTAATANRLVESGVELVTVSSHPHKADECSEYDGQTFSLTGASTEYPPLDVRPPFHPNCRHVIGPADADLDQFEAELERAAAEGAEAPTDVTASAAPANRALEDAAAIRPPFGDNVPPTRGAPDRVALQRLIDSDPGPDLEAAGARLVDLERLDKPAVEAARRELRQRRTALRKLAGPDMARELGLLRGTRPKQWAKDNDVVEDLLEGRITLEEAEELAYQHYEAIEARRIMREQAAEANLGSATRSLPCFSCGKLKRAPADVCGFCGDDPVSMGASAAEFNRAYGYIGPEFAVRKARLYGAADAGREGGMEARGAESYGSRT